MKNQPINIVKNIFILSALALAPQMALAKAKQPVLNCVVVETNATNPSTNAAVGDSLVINLNKTAIKILQFTKPSGEKAATITPEAPQANPLKQTAISESEARYFAIGFITTVELNISSANNLLDSAKISVDSYNGNSVDKELIQLACHQN